MVVDNKVALADNVVEKAKNPRFEKVRTGRNSPAQYDKAIVGSLERCISSKHQLNHYKTNSTFGIEEFANKRTNLVSTPS